MKGLSFPRILLALGLLFVFYSLKGLSYALVRQDWKMEKDQLIVNEKNLMSTKKAQERVAILAKTGSRKWKMVAVRHEVLKKEILGRNGEALHEGATGDESSSGAKYFDVQYDIEASGEVNVKRKYGDKAIEKFRDDGRRTSTTTNNSHRTPQDHQANNQKSTDSLERMILSSTIVGTPSGDQLPDHLPNTRSKNSQNPKALPRSTHMQLFHHQEPQLMTESKGESTQRLLEATQQIVNLMHRDYKGAGPNRASRKPPIHNPSITVCPIH